MRWQGRHSLDAATVSKAIGLLYGAVLYALLVGASSSSGCSRDPLPPDVRSCTRVEIRWQPSLLEYCFGDMHAEYLLSLAEKEYLQSTEVFVTEDSNRIKLFAQKVSEGRYMGRIGGGRGKIPWSLGPRVVRITCYRGNEQLASFAMSMLGTNMATKDGRRYTYRAGWDYWRVIEPPEIWPFKLRAACADGMRHLRYVGPLERRDVSSYPEPANWCDTMVRFLEGRYTIDENHMKSHNYTGRQIAGAFLCPSARERAHVPTLRSEPNDPNVAAQDGSFMVSHYAMNSNCKPDSPVDMVLLFETRPGWNQHGGPELFTFDNHDPKGGLVLLNDGTVKFIRTEEELKRLRWK